MQNLLKYSVFILFIPFTANAQISAIKFNVTTSCNYVIGKETYKENNESPPKVSLGLMSMLGIQQKISKKYFIEYGGYFRVFNINQKPVEALFSDPIFEPNEPIYDYYQFKSRLLIAGLNIAIGRKFEVSEKAFFNFSFGVGVNYSLESRENIVLLNENLDYVSEYNYYNTNKFNKFNYDCLVNIDFYRQISKRMDASIGLNYTQFINSIYQDKKFLVYPFGIGLNLGLTYKLPN